MNGRVLLGILCMTALSCAHSTPPSAATTPAPTDNEYYNQETLQGVAWMQSSVEYRASARQAYANAARALDAALADPSWNAVSEAASRATAGLPPAIILDVDETCIDNSVYEAELLRAKQLHTEARWQEYVRSGRVEAIPGAYEFLRYAESRGVTIFFVTNQNVAIEDATRANLRKFNFPLDEKRDTVLMVAERPEWTSDKTSRRLFVAQDYRVLLLLGDDFNDFVLANGKSMDERRATFDRYADWFGTRWFMIPNPVYGSWERSLTAGSGKSAKDKFESKMKSLRVTTTP